MQVAQHRPYPNIGFFFLLLLALVVAGFTPRIPGTPFFGYFGSLGGGTPVPAIIHAHALVAVSWFLMLATQAFLMRFNRVWLHRRIGWASVAVVILFVWTGIQAVKLSYAKGIEEMPREELLSLLAQPFTGLSLLLAFYGLALWKRRRLHLHVAFLVAASLAAATPGLARLGLYVIGGLPGILAAVAFIYATLVAGMLLAKFRYRQPISRSPYLVALGVFLASHALDFVGSQSRAWRAFADWMVSGW